MCKNIVSKTTHNAFSETLSQLQQHHFPCAFLFS